MKKKQILSLFMFTIVGISSLVAQVRSIPAEVIMQDNLTQKTAEINNSVNNGKKLIACPNDTIWYGYGKNIGSKVKGFLYSTSATWKAGGQYFDAPQQMVVHGFSFFGATTTSGTTADIIISLYLAGADSLPTGTPLATINTTLDYQATLSGMRRAINFSSPVTVNSAYILTFENTTSTSAAFYNNYWNNTGDTLSGRGEELNLVNSTTYGWEKAKEWNPNYDFDHLIQPFVSYDVTADFSFSPASPCIGESVTFVNNTSSVVNSRFYNYAVFSNYFKSTTYDFHFWDLGDATFVDNKGANVTHTYATDGSYNVNLQSVIYRWGTGVCYDDITKAVTVNPDLIPSVSIAITSGDNPTCPSGEITFTATATNGGAAPSYQWFINGVADASATSATYTAGPFTDQDEITCILTVTERCYSSTPATSNAIIVTVDPTLTLTPDVSIAASANPFCVGSSVTFTATSTNGGSGATFEWYVNGVLDASSVTSTFTGAFTDQDAVYCIMTSSVACASPTTATSSTITLTESPLITPSVTITESANNVCAGTTVTFTATPTNGGASANYDWYVNGAFYGTSTTTNSVTIPVVDQDAVYCIMTSSESCASPATATSNTITISVTASVTPTIVIVESANPICAGDAVTFTATPTNEGTAPVYQWKVDGVNAGTNSNVFTAVIADGEVVSCEMTSNAVCANPAVVTSNSITINEKPGVFASFVSSETSPGVVTFDASASIGAGTLSYSWNFGDGSPAGSGVTTSHTYAVNNTYTVELTVTDDCGTAVQTSTVTVVALSINNHIANNIVSVYPNPSNGIVNVNTSENASVVVYNAIGSVVRTQTTNNNKLTIDLTNEANGIYFVKVLTNSETVVRKINISK